MRKFRMVVWLAALALVGCDGILVIKSKQVAGGPKHSTVAPIKFEDFEKGTTGTYAYGNAAAGGACKVSEENKDAHGGSKALHVDYTTGSGTWGCGFGFGSNYIPDKGYFDVRGTMGLEFWAKAPKGTSFYLALKESKQNGADDEKYISADVTGTGFWKRYNLPYDSFSKDAYAGNQSGNDTLDLGGLASMECQLREKQGDGVLLLDDIYFK